MSTRRRTLLTILSSLIKWVKEKYTYLYYDEIPVTPNTNRNQDLPNTYQQVEYIATTTSDNAYIDTGISGDVGTEFILDIQFGNNTRSEQINGKTWFDNGGFAIGYALNASTTQFCAQIGHTLMLNGTLNTQRHKFNLKQETSTKAVFTVDGVSATNSSITFTTTSQSIYLFARRTAGGTDNYCYQKLYSCQFIENGTLVRDFVPCYRKSNSVIGLYDTVNGVFYTNQGTGAFTKGNDVFANVKDEARLVMIEGNSGVKNQLAPIFTNNDYGGSAGSVTTFNQNNEVSFTATATNQTLIKTTTGTFFAGNKYLIKVLAKGTASADIRLLQIYDGSSWTYLNGSDLSSTVYKTYIKIVDITATITNNSYFRIIQDTRASNWDAIFVKDLEIVNLTQEYPFDTPTSLTDNRVKKILAEGYQGFNEGTIEDSEISELVAYPKNPIEFFTGNRYIDASGNEAVSSDMAHTNKIEVSPNTLYTLTGYTTGSGDIAMCWFGENDTFISRITKSVNANESYKLVSNSPTNAKYCICNVVKTFSDVSFSKTVLPLNYQQVEYIESSGTQWIDTGVSFIMSKYLRVEFDGKIINSTGTSFVISLGSSPSVNNFLGFGVGESYSNFTAFFYGLYANQTSLAKDNLKHKFVCDFPINDNGTFAVDNNSVQLSSTSPYENNNFKLLGNESFYTNINACYSCKIYDNNILVRDFVPCYNKYTGAIGLYDLVGSTFYPNAGTGTFTKGADVNKNNTYIQLPAPVKLAGFGTSHDTYQLTPTEHVFTKNNFKYTFVGNENWSTYSNYFVIANDALGVLPQSQYFLVDKKFVFTGVGQASITGDNQCYSGLSNVGFRYDSANNNMNVFKAYIAGVSISFPLATPQTIRIPRKFLAAVDLGTLTWSVSGSVAYSDSLAGIAKPNNDTGAVANIYCSRFLSDSYVGDVTNGISLYTIPAGNIERLKVKSSTPYASGAEVAADLAGTWLFFETAAVVPDVTNVMSVEEGGTLTGYWFSWNKNQLITPNFTTQTINDVLITNNGDGSITVEGTPSSTFTFNITTGNNTILFITGHKYLFAGQLSGASQTTTCWSTGYVNLYVATEERIYNATRTDYQRTAVYIQLFNGQYVNQTFRPQLVDLTIGFGVGDEPTNIDDPRIKIIENGSYITGDTTGTLDNIDPVELPTAEVEFK